MNPIRNISNKNVFFLMERNKNEKTHRTGHIFGHSYDNWAAKTGLRTNRTQNSANLFIWIDPVVTAISSFYFFHLSFFIELSRFN